MSELLRVETHAHTVYSRDCLLPIDRIVARCRALGIDRLCVTDHNTMRGAWAMAELAPDLVIPGEEIMTSQGELLGWFMTAEIPPGLSPMATIEQLKAQGAVIGVAHPFDAYRKGAWREADLEAIAPFVDAIETFNARCVWPRFNASAAAFAAAHGLPGTAGSDAHSLGEYGRANLRMPAFDSAASFRAALPHAAQVARLSSPLVHFSSAWAKRAKKYGLVRGP